MHRFAEVAINLPQVRGTFDYHLPPHLRERIALGHLVTVPFGRQRTQGVVVSLPDSPAVAETKAIESLVDPFPVLTPAQLELAAWIANTYHAGLIDALTLMLPPGLSQQADSVIRLIDTPVEPKNAMQQKVISLLQKKGELRSRQIARAFPRQAWKAAVQALLRQGVLERESVLDPPRVRPKHVRNARLQASPDLARERVASIGKPGSEAYARRQGIIETLIAEGEAIEVSWLYAEHAASLGDLRKLESGGVDRLERSRGLARSARGIGIRPGPAAQPDERTSRRSGSRFPRLSGRAPTPPSCSTASRVPARPNSTCGA